MKVFRIGYWHSCSEFYPCGYVLAKNEKEAIKFLSKEVEGLGDMEIKEIKDIYELASKDVIDFLLLKKTKEDLKWKR